MMICQDFPASAAAPDVELLSDLGQLLLVALVHVLLEHPDLCLPPRPASASDHAAGEAWPVNLGLAETYPLLLVKNLFQRV